MLLSLNKEELKCLPLNSRNKKDSKDKPKYDEKNHK